MRDHTAFRTGDTAYFCHYPKRPPAPGMLATHYVKADNDRILAANRNARPHAFVPFVPGTDSPFWQEAVPIESGPYPRCACGDKTYVVKAWNEQVTAKIDGETQRHRARLETINGNKPLDRDNLITRENKRHGLRMKELTAKLLPPEPEAAPTGKEDTNMGCWNATCMLSNLPIYGGDPVACVLIAQREARMDPCYGDHVFAPIAPPVFGYYDEYGGLENVRKGTFAIELLRCTEFIPEDPKGEPVGRPADDEEFISGLLRHVNDGLLVKHSSILTHGDERLPVFAAMMHRRLYDMAVASAKLPAQPIEKDITYRTRQMAMLQQFFRAAAAPAYSGAMSQKELDGVLKLMDYRGPLPGKLSARETNDLVRLEAWMDTVRIPWYPPANAGSQDKTNPAIVAFHEAVLGLAVEQANKYGT